MVLNAELETNNDSECQNGGNMMTEDATLNAKHETLNAKMEEI